MKTYIALLRGINVSGQKLIKMAELKKQLTDAGLTDVQTYIQSGNIVFKYNDKPTEQIAEVIINCIKKHYGWEVPTLVITAGYVKAAVDNCSYLKDISINPDRVYFTLLEEMPQEENLNKLKEYSYPPEEWTMGDKVIYLHSPNGAGNAKYSNNFFEQKLKVNATTRNLKTLKKLIDMAL